MNSYVLQCCNKKDKSRSFNIVGVFPDLEYAKGYISEDKEYDHFIDSYDSGSPCQAQRVYKSW